MYCQKCRTQVRLDDSLDELSPAAFKLLVDTSAASQQPTASRIARPAFTKERQKEYSIAARDSRPPLYRRNVPSHRFPANGGAGDPSKNHSKHNPAMSFVMLTESQIAPNHSHVEAQYSLPQRRPSNSNHFDQPMKEALLSNKIESTQRLYEILSARSDIDHPICTECTELLVDGLQKRLASATRERDAYVEFLRQTNSDIPTEDEIKQAQESLNQLREKERTAISELETLEQVKAELDKKFLALEEEARQLDEEEESFWRDRNAFIVKLSDFQNVRDGVNNQFDHDSKQLQALQRTNVYNDTFCIGHDGFFGTINGLRLGRSSDPVVEWSEINAAWGQTCLLLATVAEKLNFTFRGYRLNPMGSVSTIEKLPVNAQPETGSPTQVSQSSKQRSSTLDLYCAGDMPLGLGGFLHRRFDGGMVAFLECLRQLGEYVQRTTATNQSSPVDGLKLPYQIQKDKISDASIKLGFNQEETWTKACKYMLTCCKFLLAHASNQRGSTRRTT